MLIPEYSLTVDAIAGQVNSDQTITDKILEIFKRPQADCTPGDDCLSVDVARLGRDKAVIFLWQGYFIRRVWYYLKSKGPFLKEKIRNRAAQWQIPMSKVVVDQDGLGGFLVDDLPGVWGFVNGASAIEEFDDDPKYRLQETKKFRFKNLRSQCYSKLADAVNNGLIGCYADVDPEVRNWIIQELEAIKKKDVEDNEKMFQVIGKDEIKKLIGRSPDFGDAMMERFVLDLGKPRATADGGYEVDVVW